MRRRSALAIAVIVGTLILSTAAPAHAAVRLRKYKGTTSQALNISFLVAKTDAGRVIKRMSFGVSLTCDDQTTQGWGLGYDFGGNSGVPITVGAFSYDDAYQFQATHVAGDIGWLSGQGTLWFTVPELTVEEQPQACTTGDLTWEVEYLRTILRAKADAPARHVVRVA